MAAVVDNTETTSVQDSQDDSQSDTDAGHEAKAREMGWKPKEQFKGDESKWIDAKSYVERGETVLPIVKAQLRKTQDELEEVKKAALAWTAHTEAAAKREVGEWKAKYDAAIQSKKDAIAQGDGEKVIEAEAAIDDLKASKPQPQKETPKVHPDFAAWKAENPWYQTDEERTLQANLIGARLAAQGLQGRKLFDAVNEKLAEFEKMASGTARAGAQRGGKPSAETKGVKSYENLKPEMRAECDRQFKHFGGKGTPEAWRARWISQADDTMFRS